MHCIFQSPVWDLNWLQSQIQNSLPDWLATKPKTPDWSAGTGLIPYAWLARDFGFDCFYEVALSLSNIKQIRAGYKCYIQQNYAIWYTYA